MPHHLVEHTLFGVEVKIDRSFRHACACGDVLQPGSGVSCFDEFLEGGVEDLGGPFSFASLAFLDLARHLLAFDHHNVLLTFQSVNNSQLATTLLLTFQLVNNSDVSVVDQKGHFHATMAPILPISLLLGACEKNAAEVRTATMVRTEVVRLEPRQAIIRLTGDVQARVRTELSFRVSGHVTERLVDVGAHVNAGDVLAKIDPAEQQADLEGSKAAVSSAEAQLRVATASFERQKSLMATGFTTRVSYDQAQEALQTAEGTLEAAKAQLGTSTDALTYTELRASAAEIITARNVEVGQVAQSAQSAYTLAEDGARDAVFDLYEFDLPAAAA